MKAPMLYSVLSGLSCLLKNVYREEEMQNTSFSFPDLEITTIIKGKYLEDLNRI